MRKPVPAKRQTGRVGQLLFVAQQAAQALAIERLEPLGLSPRAWGVLSTLAESGPVTQIELATTMSIDRTAMVYLLDELEHQALVERVRSMQDRRAFLIHLTPAWPGNPAPGSCRARGRSGRPPGAARPS